MQAAKKRKVSDWHNVRGWFRNFIWLSYLLGITWVIGFINDLGDAVQYIFILLNTSSGIFILIYSVVLNSKVGP